MSTDLRPSWVDDTLFPFRSRFVEVDGHRLHYVDEGSGPTLLLLHGNPTWSFLYRHIIADLRSDHRCVAVDYPGFGLSTPAPGYSHLPEDHARVVGAFVDHLDLEGFTLMVQDWGGPIGIGMAARRRERVERLVIGNTWAWPVGSDRHFSRFSAMFGGRIGTFLIVRFNLFVNLLVHVTHPQTRLTRREMDHYRRPFSTPSSRLPIALFPQQMVAGHRFLETVERGLSDLSAKPALIVWGDRDAIFRTVERERFEHTFPNHRTVRLPRAGHYIQDDAPAEVIAAMREFLAT